MKKEQAIPNLREKGEKFIKEFEGLELSLSRGGEAFGSYLWVLERIWKEVQALEIEEKETTVLSLYELIHWFFYPEGDPIGLRQEAGGNVEEDYGRLVLNLLYDRSLGQYPCVEWSGSFLLSKMHGIPKKDEEWQRKWPDDLSLLDDAMSIVADQGVLFLRSFERYYDCLRGKAVPKKMEREVKTMQDLWESVASMEVEFESVRSRKLLALELVEWFFKSGGDVAELMLHWTSNKEEAYNRFTYELLFHFQQGEGHDIEEALQVLCTKKRT